VSALLEPFIHEPRIAYFSMEIALASEIPTYSGGLGVLAGDTMRSAADLHLPMIGVTLASRAGIRPRRLGRDHERRDHPQRLLLQQPPHDAPLCGRGVSALMTGSKIRMAANRKTRPADVSTACSQHP
jgi:starch phosphorylase